MANHGHEEEVAPERTIYQWSPEEEVEHGHEGRDVDLVAVGKWFVAVAVLIGATIVVMIWVFNAWSSYERRVDVLPSTMFGVRQIPPEPRVMPNPVDTALHPEQPVRGPSELYHDFRQTEDQALIQAGLLKQVGPEDQDRTPALPPNAMAAIGPAAAAPNQAATSSAVLAAPMPSYSSGGTAWENDAK